MMKFYIVLGILFLVETVTSWKLKAYPYADLNFEQKVAHDGYPLEQYQVRTKDNYYLTIFRIPYGKRSTNSTQRSPVLLIPGMGASVDMFVLLGPGKALAYFLADSGYDVWLLNGRGCWKSQRHKFYNLNKHRQYWKYSFHEIAIHDLAKNIDFVLDKTKQKPFLIGHSQGNTCMFVLLAMKPEYNDKIFRFHEIAIYDLATNIDFILEKTKQKPFLIGHSQGNTCIFVLLAMKPDYNDKIKMGVAYAPTIKIVVDNIVAKVFVYGEEMVEV
uniref:Lipase 3-like n=1 Tax=Diabrotica virgifera virgifera TaxID=50390 RepID=A0A6P7GNP7_DIAVI